MDRVLNRADRRARLAQARRDPNVFAFESKPEAVRVFARQFPEWGVCVGCYASPRYSAQVYERQTSWGGVTHLAIRRHDGQPEIPWASKQAIKNALGFTERVAVEVFPAVAELTDQANMYHLWVLPVGFELPFALEDPR